MEINTYGEIINKKDYYKLEKSFNKSVDELNENDRLILKNKVRCYCGLILSNCSLRNHINSSKKHKRRLRDSNLNYYINPIKPFSRIPKTITKHYEKIIINFD